MQANTPPDRWLRISLDFLENWVDPVLMSDLEADPVRMSQDMQDYLREAVACIALHHDMTVSAAEAIPIGSIDEVQLLFCSPSAFHSVLGQEEGTIGVHLVSTPDGDPFGDEAPDARAWRVVIPWDEAIIHERIRDAVADFDGHVDEDELPLGAMSWLITITKSPGKPPPSGGGGIGLFFSTLTCRVDASRRAIYNANNGENSRPCLHAEADG